MSKLSFLQHLPTNNTDKLNRSNEKFVFIRSALLPEISFLKKENGYERGKAKVCAGDGSASGVAGRLLPDGELGSSSAGRGCVGRDADAGD